MKSFYKAGGVPCLLPATPLQLFSIFIRRAFTHFLPCCIFLLLFGLPDARSQSPEKQEAVSGGEIQPLRVGDYVPESFWEEEILIYDKRDTTRLTLEVFRGRPLLLDFWATWCGYCVQGFPTLLDIKNDFEGDIDVLLVNSEITNDTFEKIDGMPSDILRKNNLQTIIKDKYLHRLFPHGPIPHYVWINNRGRVSAITFREFVNNEQVDGFINKSKKNENNN